MKKNIVNELNEMKYLFGYKRGRVISEQKEVPMEEDMDFDVMGDKDIDVLDNVDYEDDDFDFEVPTMEPGTKEKERTITKPGTRPDKDWPYKPKPGPKKKPKAENERRMPSWLSFDELGIDMREN